MSYSPVLCFMHCLPIILNSRKHFMKPSFSAKKIVRKKSFIFLNWNAIVLQLSCMTIFSSSWQAFIFFLKHYKEDPESNAEVLDDIDRMLGDSISDVRNLSHDLSSLADGKIDLIQKVDDLLLKTERFSGIDFDFSHGLQREIPKFYAVNLYRIIQELVLNTVKHSGAKSSKVSLTESGEQLILIYADDGKGASGADNDGIGMLNIRYRISSLSGIMTLGIFPNGFSMQVNLPLQSLSNSSIE